MGYSRQSKEEAIANSLGIWEVTDCPFPEIEEPPCCTFVYSEMTEHWIGQFGYDFDKYLVMDDSTIYGMREGQTYLLNEGDQIKGFDIAAWVLTAASPTQVKDKEFLRLRVNSDNKPMRVEFFTSMNDFIAGDVKALLNAELNPLHLKNYYGYEQYIPRRLDNSDRMQGRVMLYKIFHQEGGTEFTLVDTEVQYKVLK